MAQLVFIHGVATRNGPDYAQTVANRDLLFQSILFKDSAVDIHAPLWGDFVPRIDPKVFDTDGQTQSYAIGGPGLGAGLGGQLGGGGAFSATSGGPTFADLAATNPTVALDALFVGLLDETERQGRVLSAEELAAFATATSAAEAEQPSLLSGAKTDKAILERLAKGQDGSFGVMSAIGAATAAVGDRLRNSVSTLGFGAIRDRLSPAVGMFLGDVFAYLRDGQLREQIRSTVRESLTTAQAAKAAGKGPLIVIGHSLGGVILCDMLLDPQSGLPSDLAIDALITVGSQPGLFQSVGALAPQPVDGGRWPRPANVAHWFNVFDPIDPLAFATASVFEGVEDYAFDSVTGLASAHTTYFKRPQFYARCRQRLLGLNLL